ncbi:hypothetical protein BC940DRAFT_322837 [Gongronella butleri]|nr:hypothetical protein BC940DRAFT_322837 [Gongronella butleri]
MVGLIDKVKSQIEIWKIERYTKRRTFLPEYDSRDSEYYKQHYRDGVYYNDQMPPPSPASPQPGAPQYNRKSLSKRMSVMIKKKPSNGSLPHPRCSETYNSNYAHSHHM